MLRSTQRRESFQNDFESKFVLPVAYENSGKLIMKYYATASQSLCTQRAFSFNGPTTKRNGKTEDKRPQTFARQEPIRGYWIYSYRR
jgi:hypothetical protein